MGVENIRNRSLVSCKCEEGKKRVSSFKVTGQERCNCRVHGVRILSALDTQVRVGEHFS